MKTKTIWILVGFVIVLILSPMIWLKMRASRLNSEYQIQIMLASKEGLPTTPQEFAATLPIVKDQENAAPYYMQLVPMRSQITSKSGDILWKLNTRPDNAAITEARAYLTTVQAPLELVDKAVALPHCQFNRNWSDGIALLNPELYPIKLTARLFLIRGAIAASEGRPEEALIEARKTLRMSQHLKEDPLQISQLVSRGIYSSTLTQLAYWSFAHRDQPAYRKELEAALNGLLLPDLKAEHRFDLIKALSAIELCSTEEGQMKLGLKKEDISKGEKLLPLLQSPAVGRIKVVKGMREYWTALGGPIKGMDTRARKAEFHFYQGLISFPTAAKVYEVLEGNGRGVTYELNQVIAWKVAYRAMLRAFSSKKTPKSINTKDLLSPWDGKPVRYQSDGKKIEITVSADKGEGDPFILALPPRKIKPLVKPEPKSEETELPPPAGPRR